MKNNKIYVRTKSKTYPIYVGNNILSRTGKLINKNIPGVKKIYIICDDKLPGLFLKNLVKSLKGFDIKIKKLFINEKTKNLIIVNKLIEELLRSNFSRSDCIISLGGGIVGDVAAFVASLTKRGMKFINIPTTLLAQCDASIGGKTGVNSNQGKNLIGTFYQPDFVLTDINTLNTLPRREMICGYGEILKHSLISNRKFFFWLCKNAKKLIYDKNKNILKKSIITSCKIKSQIVTKDEKEKNLRMILNFGHTFAHGFEATKKFSGKINHGEAVLLGMAVATQLSHNKKIISSNDFNLVKKHYVDLNLPSKISTFFKKYEINKIISFMKSDKKNYNKKINLILLKKVGEATKPNNFNIKSSDIKKFLIKNYN